MKATVLALRAGAAIDDRKADEPNLRADAIVNVCEWYRRRREFLVMEERREREVGMMGQTRLDWRQQENVAETLGATPLQDPTSRLVAVWNVDATTSNCKAGK